jgi:TonB dependent receptor
MNLAVFGAPIESGRQGASIQESMDLTGSNYYNPSWGYQNGKKRNVNIAKLHQPYIILTHDFKISNSSALTTAAGFSFGERSNSGLDWYNAADPRPDYYRYLPSYQENPSLRAMVANEWRTNPSISQINWDGLIQSNKINRQTINNVNGIPGNTVTGLRSSYIVEDRVVNTNRFNFNTVFNKRVSTVVEFMAGASYQFQSNNYFKRLNDLLGGDFYMDLNQFAERDFANTPGANQNNLNSPNRLLNEGDKFGYNYTINVARAATWAQTVLKFKKVDAFFAVELSNTNFYREGFNRNGLFPNNSFGKSANYSFTNYAVKGGITYKIDGRNYLYASAAQLTRAPFFDNVFISPRTRDFVQDNISNETIQTVEAGYVLNSPTIRARLSGYATRFKDQMNVITFFHDEYRNFVNYALNGIDKVHFGGELGIEARLNSTLSLTAAAGVGRFYFDNRQNANITVDNSATPLGNETIFAQNYRISNTPQEAYSIGLSYRSPKFWFVNLTGNYFDYMWLDFNPVRRTNSAVDGVEKGSATWNNVLNQTRFSGQATVDFFGGYSYRVPRSWGFKRTTYIVFNLGINNLLNNQNINTGGFEQLRFDFGGKDPNRFPPRLFYAFGLNYFASINIRFQ